MQHNLSKSVIHTPSTASACQEGSGDVGPCQRHKQFRSQGWLQKLALLWKRKEAFGRAEAVLGKAVPRPLE